MITRFVHGLANIAFTIPMQPQGQEALPVKTLALLSLPDGPKVLSGSTDGNVKVFSVNNGLNSQGFTLRCVFRFGISPTLIKMCNPSLRLVW